LSKIAPVLFFALAVASGAMSQDLSTSVYPSEDELYLALLAGDIDYHQFLVLSEAIRDGIDAEDRYLFDDIPNLGYFADDSASLSTYLEREQEAGFVRQPLATNGGPHGEIRYRLFQNLDETPESRYRLNGLLDFADWTASFAVLREADGSDRMAARHISYRGDGVLRALQIGNFSRRLGLGSACGYRGRLLESPTRLGAESFVFPDYGGFNGGYARLQKGVARMQLLTSLDRDSDHSLLTSAGHFSADPGSFAPGLTVAVNRLRNRHSGATLTDIKLAPTARYRYHGGYASAEVCFQSGDRASFGAVLLEGRHRFTTAQIKYAAWLYDDAYLDLSGGSKTGLSRRDHYLEEVSFEFSERRSGHKGGELKTVVLVTSRTELVNSFLYSGQRRDSSDTQWLSALVQRLRHDLSVRLDHLVKTRRRLESGTGPVVTSHRTRLEMRFTSGRTVVRSYIAYNTKSGRSDYLSAFVRLDWQTSSVGKLELWSNLARLDGRKGTMEYWYQYLRYEQLVWGSISLATKFSHAYDRDAGERHRNALALEVRATW